MMKKNYISPKAELLRFISAECLATNANIDFDDLLKVTGGSHANATTPSVNDISLPLA